MKKTWADVAGDLVSYIPAVFALVLITNTWDSEWLVIACLLAGAGGKAIINNLKAAKAASVTVE